METFFMLIMALTSVVGLTFIVERGIMLRWGRVIPPAVEQAVEACRSTADRSAVHAAAESHPSPLSRLLLSAEQNLDLGKEENENALQTRARHEISRLERGLVILEIVVGIAPLMGLVGTIYGMMTLFAGLGESGLGDNAVLARGISYILRFTMMGLLIAIPSLIAWSYYSKKVEMLAVEMENICSDFLRRLYHASAAR
jgi:biopolymer transport protein ExbB